MQQAILDNRYVLQGPLGSGGMGKVFLARDRVLERDVALKLLREQYAESDEFVGRFEREAKAAASLNHPNIVQVYDRGRAEDGAYYMAMEYVPGGTLKDRILDGPMDPGEAVRLGGQVADALGAAHGRGIVHRDVKPQNVLLTAHGNAKVADFGIARAASADPLSNSSLVLGTAKYMSPEQAMGGPLGPESDLYSLGVVLYEMLTGELPFDADSAIGVAMKHVNEPPRPPREKNPAVSAALDAVTMKLLEKRPEDRYPGAAELAADLSRVDEGRPPAFAAAPRSAAKTERLHAPTAAPGSQGGAVRRFPRVGRRGLLAVALVAMLGLIGAALLRDLDGPVLGALGGVAEGSQRALGVGEGEVPRVVGLTEGDARERLAEEGFGVAVERRESAERDEGRVLEQSVSAGKEARRGSRVALAVGDGQTTVEAPDLAGMSPSEAEEELRRAGLKLGERRESPSRDVPEGKVAAQKPAAGEETKRGAEVDLTVSSGPPESGEADWVEIPDVSGLGVEEATELLRGEGYEVAGTRREPSSEPEGAVIGTDPPTGKAVAPGTPVILLLSDGPGEPPADGPSAGYADQPEPSPSSAPATAPADPPTDPPADPPADASAPSSPAPSSPPPSSAPAAPPPSSAPPASEPAEPAPSSASASPSPSSPGPSSSSPAPSFEEDEEVEEEGAGEDD